MLAIKKWGAGVCVCVCVGGGGVLLTSVSKLFASKQSIFVFWPRVFVYATLMLSSCGDPMWLTGHNNPVTDRR